MDLPCNELDFQLTFCVGKDEILIPVKNFYSDEKSIYVVEPSIEIIEFIQVKVLFTSSDSQAKLRIEGIEELGNIETEEDESGPFICPNEERKMLFSYDDYPLIPGFYQIIINIGETTFYASMSVKPLHVSQPAWVSMRDELETLIPGLGMDLVFRNLGFYNNCGMHLTLPPYTLFGFLIINKKFSTIMSALSDLLLKANFKLKKEYVDKDIDRTFMVDDKSFEYLLSKPSKSDTIKSPIKTLNYDLLENRWIKVIITLIRQVLDDFTTVTNNYISELKKEIIELERYGSSSLKQRNIKANIIADLNIFCQRAIKIKSAIKIIESSSWYQELTPLQNAGIPSTLFFDSRYNMLYRLYRQLKTRDTSIIIDKSYAFQWKRSDKLYELWCFIQIYQLIKEIGFEPLDGWLCQLNNESCKMLVPAIKSGTYVKFGKEDVTIKLHYDEYIPYTSEETNSDNKPLYIGDVHNKPDIRMDVYIYNIYAGSILMDVKYRKPNSFWNPQSLKTHLRSDAMKQLTCYSAQCSSIYLYGDKKNEKIRPVPEIWVLYPDGVNYNNKFFKDHRIRFIFLAPDNPDNILKDLLEDKINEFKRNAYEECDNLALS